MTFVFGEKVNIGLGGSASNPAIWVPGRTPTGFKPVIGKTMIRETRGGRAASQASEIVRKHAEGPLEFNVRSNSMHYILRSLLGSAAGSLKGGESAVYDYEYRVTDSPIHRYNPLALASGAFKSYHYPKGFVKSLELRTPVSDVVNATVQMQATTEEERESAYSPAFTDDDFLFRNHEVTIKLAADVDGLAAAPELKVKEFSNTINNNGRGNQTIGNLTDDDILGMIFDVSGNMVLDCEGETIRDIYTGGVYRALQITLERNTTIGEASKPKYVFTYPRISIENWTPDRPMDDIIKDNIEFIAHWDEDEGGQIFVDGVNEIAEDVEGS
jgi:hypothetical protein